ncbi:PrsW family intramembrane metalloprotease [Candidatus Peregrinibacteria bacterium]|nr:PrsW family intramembrane metalloprotease [Candidatus Peregrinibacteria bacterium]
MQTLFYSIVLLFATFFWGYLFYKKDYHPQPFKVVAQIFGIGLFSMAPIFAYKAIYGNFLPGLAEYRLLEPFLKSAFLMGIATFLFNLVLLSAILFAGSALVACVLTFFKKDTFRNMLHAFREEELGFAAVGVMVALMAAAQSFAGKALGSVLLAGTLGSVMFLVVMEEYIKHLIVRFVDDKKLKDVDDAITLSIMVGLAFAVIETLMYAIQGGDFSVVLYRAMLSLPIHLVASGIFGYYYGLARFADPLTGKAGGKLFLKTTSALHFLLTFRRSTVYAEKKIVEGLALATLFHAACNVLFELNLAFLVVPIVIIGLVMVSFLYKESHNLYRIVHAH